MNESTFDHLSTKYGILEKIGFEEYQIKIWIMSHMDMQDKIDIQGFGKFSCKSFMRKNKSYQDLIQQVNDLVNRKVLFIVDKNASLIEYRFAGESQYEFQKLILGAMDEFRRKEAFEIQSLFENCLRQENESSFITANLVEYFKQTKREPKQIKAFFSDYLVANASSYALFLLSLFT